MRWILTSFLLASTLSAQEVRTVQVASGLGAITDIQSAGDGSGRLFLVEQSGTVRILSGGALLATPFLDIRSKVSSGGERGLLGIAFPPGFAQSQRFYVNYTDTHGDTVVAQYRVSANPDQADSTSEITLLKIPRSFSNHNGGQLQFGPDGYLYIGVGDGGSSGDPDGNGQNLGTLLGKILRVDVESAPGALHVPQDNPFLANPAARPEIWATGLRNPWRFSFDRTAHDLWIADVGQNLYEEINVQPAASHGGENYGWKIMEGRHCYDASTCNSQGLTLPVLEYSHSLGCSVTGGYVYRGAGFPGLWGYYLYADYCTGTIWAARWNGTGYENQTVLSSGLQITTFGQDEAGEIYAGDSGAGRIYRIEPAPGSPLEQCSYSLAASGQSFTAAGGAASLEIRTAPYCTWDVSGAAGWVTLDSPRAGSGDTTLQFSVAANPGPARTTTIRIAGLAHSVDQAGVEPAPLPVAGALPHFAVHGGFTTSLTLVNTGATPASATLAFTGADGLPLPLQFASVSAATLTRTLPAGSSMVLEASADDSLPTLTGSALLSTDGNVSGFAILRWTALDRETLVPLETRHASAYVVPFDNLAGYTTAIALANLSAQSASITVNLRDSTGALLQSDTLALPARGQLSYLLPERHPAAADRRGTAEFITPSGGRIAVLGLRIKPDGTLSAIPVLAP